MLSIIVQGTIFNPKLSHKKALNNIGRYLKATRDRGLSESSSAQSNIEGFPDADFAGLYGFEKSNNPTCTNSRTGFLINVSDCPVSVL